MMQLYTEQVVSSEVKSITPLDDEVLMFLDPTKRTTVVELSGQSLGGILAFAAKDVVPIGITDGAFPDLRLFMQGRETHQPHFYGPSHVASPELTGVIGAGLRVTQIGVTMTNPAGVVTARSLAAHVYIDQAD